MVSCLKADRFGLSDLFRYLRLVWCDDPYRTVLGLIFAILQGLLPLVTLYLTKLAVDCITGTLAYDSILGFKSVTVLIALLGMATLLEAAANSVNQFINLVQGTALTDRMFEIMHSKSTELDLEYYESAQYYDRLHQAQQEAPARPTRVLNNVRYLIQNSISVVVVGGLLLWLHWGLIVVLLLAAVPGVLVRIRYARKMHTWQSQKTPVERKAAYLNWMLTQEAYAKEIRVFGLGSLFMDRFRRLQSELFTEKLKLVKKKTLAELLSMSIAICVSFGLLGYLAMRTIKGVMSLGDLVMFYAAVQRGQALLRQVFNGLGDLYEDNLFLGRLYRFLELKPKLQEATNPQFFGRRLRSGIVFDHVTFRYPQNEHCILDDVSLTIRPGEHVALVGENGVGKTTWVKLLCRLYDPTRGAILLDGIDLKQYASKDLRRNITVVFQDFGRYQLTVRENIWLGNINVPPDGKYLEPAVHKAGVHPVISQLAHGYDTVLGKWFDGGQELSAGEWQKIAIARAFLHDGEIIILDEPSSSLDAQAEYELFERFHQLVRKKTAILISHRLSTVKMVDCIYVLDRGRIAEFGSHNELIKKGRIYARMFETQAQRYR